MSSFRQTRGDRDGDEQRNVRLRLPQDFRGPQGISQVMVPAAGGWLVPDR